ncbi:hypothetical protein PL11201_630011 [Planktothrix sp. PCC 11201]|uniref:hypothetical protein n=1 Tax=Planktothrix sp. PCC 11201 TaxID=1729650 RepID=UPI000915E4C1|nr:hypothetical protein [Planktothrix sp. PCC 11201]SKB14363.1 hypothetical protein PL11201_630011 [Planktothrix sp. PCC 11201]
MGILDLVSQRNLRLLTTFGAIVVGGVACPLIPALQGIGLLQCVSAIGTGLAGNIFAGDLGAIVNSLGQEDILSNNDLTKAVGLAVGLLLKSIATSEPYRSFQKPLKKLATSTPKKWLKLTEVLIHCLQQQRFLLVLDNLESVLQDEGYQKWRITP